MSISTETRASLHANLKYYEGRVKHLYLDTKGKVTIGVGHLIASKNAVSGITLYKTQKKLLTQPATLEEKMAEYEMISNLPWGKRNGAVTFKPHTTLVMKDSDINFLLNKHIDKFYTELKTIYKKENGYSENFDDFDTDIQLALFDMIFNLGATKLVKSFPKFNTAIKTNDLGTAAKECHRLDINDERNKYVEDLFLNLLVEA